jgi:sialic acid synthase SpsE
MSDATFIIAELGSAWEGHFGTAVGLIQDCAEAGASAVKTQWCSNPARMAARRNTPELADQYQALAWPAGWHTAFSDECRRQGVEYMCTVYLPEDIAVIAPHVQRFKVSSFEAGDKAFVYCHERHHKPILISTGLANLNTCWGLWATLINGVSLLHCTSAYPAPADEINLSAIMTERPEHGPLFSGLSDHSANVLTGALAVAAGATILEVHVRPDNCPPSNPDYPHSLTLEQFRQYVANVRFAELAMGDGVKRVMPSEEVNLRYRVKGGA